MKETLSGRQVTMLIMMYIIGSSVLFVAGIDAKRDIWIAMIIAIAVGGLLSLIYSRLCSILPGKDFYGVMEFFFGKVVGKILLAFLVWFAFDLCVFVLIDFGIFISSVGLETTPINMVALVIMMTCALAVYKGIEVIARWNQITAIFVVAFIAIVVVIAYPKLDVHHLLPTLYHGWEPVIKGARGIISFPIAETVAFLLVLPAFKKGVNSYKAFYVGITLGGIVLLVTSVVEILVMDIHYAEMSLFPFYEAVSALRAGNVFSRLEIIAATVFTLTVFLKLSVLLLASSKGLTRILGFNDYRFVIIPISLLIGTVAAFSFHSIPVFHTWIFEEWPVYSALFELIIPIGLWVFIEIKYRILKKQQKLPDLAA